MEDIIISDEYKKKVHLMLKMRDYSSLIELRLNSSYNELLYLRKTFHKELKNKDCRTFILVSLGSIELYLSNLDKAYDYFEKALLYIRGLPRDNVLSQMAYIDYCRKDYMKALEKSLQNVHSIESDIVLYSYFMIGRIYYQLGNTSLTIKYFNEGYQKTRSIFFLKEIALVYIQSGNMEEALNYYIKTIKFSRCIDNDDYIKILYLCKECNVFIKDISLMHFNDTYLKQQVLHYSIEDLISHIWKHYNDSQNENFKSNIDSEELIDKLSKSMNENNRIRYIGFCKKYIIEYPNVGTNGSSHVIVIALPNNQIITAFPYSTEIRDDLDFHELDKIKKNVKVYNNK